MAPQQRDIGRFTGATMIGRGGFGAVYAADDPEHGRQVAIKILSGELGERERRRFDRERQTMGRLGSHPNIIPVHESGYTDEGEGYIVMELAKAGSLRTRIDNDGPLGWEEATDVSIAIAGAAQAAHDEGVLHRDIKPDNILIDAYGNPRLTDFGIAAVASNATATTSTTATLAHAAPELLNGDTSTGAVDVYAIGSTFYNLVLGHPPFLPGDHAGVTAMIGRALTQPPPDLRPHGVPHAVAAVIEKSMAKDPGERQRSAAQLAEELRAAKANPGAGTIVAPLPDQPPSSQTVVAGGPTASPDQLIAQGLGKGLGRGPAGVGHSAPTPPDPGQVPSQADIATGTVPGTVVAPATGAHGAPPHLQTPTHGFQGGTAPIGGQVSQQTAAGQPPIGPGGHGQFVPSGGSGNRTPLILALAVLAIGIIGVAAVLVLGSGDDTATGPTTTPSTATDEDEPGGTTEPDDPTGGSTEESTTPSSSQTSETTVTTEVTTTPSSADTLPPDTAPPVDPECPILVVDGQTARFDVRICTDGAGTTTYQGLRRDTGDGITLEACFSGFGVFVAENEGFLYQVDTDFGSLDVIDPDLQVLVSEDIIEPFFVDLTTPYTLC
ncbi:MAG: protein kinase [Actinomycetota bacterium]